MLKVNRNYLWSESFVNALANVGLKYCCISPGSRNTPLTIAFAQNKNIKSFINVDERNSAFLALGLAKSSGTPVAVVCTSGTATAEIYPAIIEAYQQRVPLIICTADRPGILINTGANQTINQNNIFVNHIRYFFDAGLPSTKLIKIKKFLERLKKTLYVGLIKDRGPVHINFPFEKPLEPDSYTDRISLQTKNKINLLETFSLKRKTGTTKLSTSQRKLLGDIKKFQKGLIIIGPQEPLYRLRRLTSIFSQVTGYPVFADGCSQLRYGKHNKSNILINFDTLLRLHKYSKSFKPELIIQFGRTPTSKSLEKFFCADKSKRYVINEFADNADPARTAFRTFKSSPEMLFEKLLCELNRVEFKRKSSGFAAKLISDDKLIETYKKIHFNKIKFPNEIKIIQEVLKLIPDNCNLFISNSTPVRDLDNFGNLCDRDIRVFNNRGASGIDGITSTAIGIAYDSKQPTILITGDLSFYYDINTLVNIKTITLPFIIILINNNGGGLFRTLPISKNKKYFNDFFLAGQKLNFNKIVSSFGIEHKEIENLNRLSSEFLSSLKTNKAIVFEIKTDSKVSLKIRQDFRNKAERLFR